jgi:sulfofructosephosphate aldolase
MIATAAPTGRAPEDADLTAFKVRAARALTPAASAVLLDVDFGLGPVRNADAIAPGCGLIVAADLLTQEPGGPVEWTAVAESVLADDEVAAIADAYKLLVIWRPGEAARRAAVVEAFVAGCRRRGRAAIVEGIVRNATGSALADDAHADVVLEAAIELAGLGADLYKAEVPTLGAADDAVIERHAARMTEALPCPWVVLSNGTPPARFGTATLAACRGGASGFLAGRAIWSDALAAPDIGTHLATVARPRLAALGAAVDEAIAASREIR